MADDALTRLGRIAELQHGVFTSSQAQALGISTGTLARRKAKGYYQEIETGVLAVGGSVDSWRRTLTAAILSEGDLAAASHQTAAFLLGLIDRKGGEIHVVTRRWLRRPRPEIRLHESTDLTESDIIIVDGIPVTNPARTLVDLGATAPWLVRGALGAALRSEMTTLDEIERFIARVARRGRRGVGVIRPLIRERRRWEQRTDSFLEDEFMAKVIVRHDLPEPVTQSTLADADGRFVCRADFAYPAAKVLIELDGFGSHSDESAFQRDRTKQNRAVLLGWTVLRYTWQDVMERPGAIAAEIRAVLA